jgi:hypothetical protein
MANKRDIVDPAVVAAINKVLAARMGRYGFTSARVEPGLDHDGDEVLFIEAVYPYSEIPLTKGATYGLGSEVRRALEDLGESRFPHIRHRFDQRQRTANSA